MYINVFVFYYYTSYSMCVVLLRFVVLYSFYYFNKLNFLSELGPCPYFLKQSTYITLKYLNLALQFANLLNEII